MRRTVRAGAVWVALAVGVVCLVPRGGGSEVNSRVVKVALLHMNDTYETEPLSHGAIGGLARMATLRNQLAKENQYTHTLHAADFLSPSAYFNSKVDDRRLAGRHMVAVLSQMGVDFLILGNQELDLKREEFDERLGELSQPKALPMWMGSERLPGFDELQEQRWPLFLSNLSSLDKALKDVASIGKKSPRYQLIDLGGADQRSHLHIRLMGLTNKEPEEDTYTTHRDQSEAALEQLETASVYFPDDAAAGGPDKAQLPKVLALPVINKG